MLDIPSPSLGECIACGGDMQPCASTLRLEDERVIPLLARRCSSCEYETTTSLEEAANRAICKEAQRGWFSSAVIRWSGRFVSLAR